MELNISQSEYERLRTAGMSKDEIFAKYAKKKKSVGQKILDAGTAVSKFIGAEGIAEQYGASIARTKLKLQGNEDAAKLVENPSLKKVVGSAIQTGANFLPGAGAGAGLATKVAVGAGTGYAFDVGRNLQLGKSGSDMFKPGAGTLVGGALPVVSKVLGYATKDLTAKMARKLEQVNMRLTPTELANLKKKTPELVKFMADKKIVGTPEVRLAKLEVLYDDMERQVQKAVAKQSVTFQRRDIVDAVRKMPDAFVDDPTLAAEATRVTNELIESLNSKRGEAISANAVNELKRSYMKRAFSKNTSDVVSESRLAIASYLKGLLDESVSGLKSLNGEYGSIIAARRILSKAVGRKEIGLIGNLVGVSAGMGIGNMISPGLGAIAGGVVGPQIGKAVAGTAARSTLGAGAQTISNIATRISKLPTDKAGNISRKAILNLLESLRSSQ